MNRYYGHQYRFSLKAKALIGKRCQLCNSDKHINVHHLDMNPRNNNPANWQILCASCHSQIHSKYFGMIGEEKKRLKDILKMRWYRKYKQKRRLKIPCIIGYIRGKEVCDILGISKQRLNQIKDRLEYVVPFKKVILYKRDSLNNFIRGKRGRPKKKLDK